MDELLVGLAAALCFVFGWNNSSFLIGNLRGAGSLSFVWAIILSVAGLLIGTLLEGSKMGGALAGSLAPSTTYSVLLSVLAVSVALTLVLTLLDLPVSFSMIMVGAFLGATFATSIPVNMARSEEVIGFWFLAPLATALITFGIYDFAAGFASRFGILAVDSMNRAGAIVSGLAVSYTLGANNIGLFYAGTVVSAFGTSVDPMTVLILVLAGTLGVVALGRTALGGTMGDKMLTLSPQGVFSAFVSSSIVVWVGTQFGLPVSISQCLLGGMLGAAYSRIVAAVNRKLVGETLSMWVVAPLVAFAAAYAVANFV
ncbi:MAG: inorganic phosphate transporter [Nitrososphaerota archaeon]|nr:inorganic phosphate transporter [Nitrososphaerota archaeon]MDG7024132.1 inorganic phosphate transporter [Nitrososphaerota archaeon]